MTTNGTYDDYEEYIASEGVLIFAGFVIIFMILLAIVGNTLTIFSFIRDQHLRNTYNIYLVNLAVADLVIAVISMTIYLTYTLRKNTWVYGYDFCKVYSVLDYTACCVTVVLMNVISYDRLMLLKQGAMYYMNQTKKKAIVKIVICWMFGFLLYGPAIIGWDIWTGESVYEPGDCDVQFAHNKIYTTTTAVLEFFIPLFTLGLLNTLVIVEIRRLRHNKVHVQVKPTVKTIVAQSQSIATAAENIDASDTTGKSKQRSTKKAHKAARALAILVITFFVTWAPYTITTVVMSFCECENIPMYETFTWILWFKSAFNPFLYAFSSIRFRENFVFFLSCGKKSIIKK